MAETNKYIVLEQLQKVFLKGKADYISRIRELTEVVSQALENDIFLGITVTLPSASWESKSQTVKESSLMADNNYWYIVCSDADCYADCVKAGIIANDISVTGEITFQCKTVPGKDITMNIIRLEVSMADG